MGDSVANAVGKGPALILTVDGEDYILAPLKMEDLADVELEAKRRHRADVLAIIKDAGNLLTPEHRLEMFKDLSIESRSALDFLGTMSGLDYLLTLRIRRSYPDMSEEEIKSLVTVQAIKDMEREVAELVGLDKFIGEDEGDASPPDSG